MANWKNKIVVEVKLPYTTQGCTLDYLTAKIEILQDSVSFSGHNKDTLRWKSEQSYGDYRILISGKAVTAPKKKQKFVYSVVCRTTTYKVTAFYTYDGINNGNEQYKVKVISYN